MLLVIRVILSSVSKSIVSHGSRGPQPGGDWRLGEGQSLPRKEFSPVSRSLHSAWPCHVLWHPKTPEAWGPWALHSGSAYKTSLSLRTVGLKRSALYPGWNLFLLSESRSKLSVLTQTVLTRTNLSLLFRKRRGNFYLWVPVHMLIKRPLLLLCFGQWQVAKVPASWGWAWLLHMLALTWTWISRTLTGWSAPPHWATLASV